MYTVENWLLEKGVIVQPEDMVVACGVPVKPGGVVRVPGGDPGSAERHVPVVVMYLSSLEVWLGCQVGTLVLLSVMCQ